MNYESRSRSSYSVPRCLFIFQKCLSIVAGFSIARERSERSVNVISSRSKATYSRICKIYTTLGEILTNATQLISRAFHAGIDPDPVMCQTINTTLTNNCGWASCGEWCLTRTTGFCPQIHATVRRNGTDIVFKNCTKFSSISCPQVCHLRSDYVRSKIEIY